MRSLLRIQTGARTDLGRVRKNNEDSYQIEPALSLFVLSDGMGGEAHGEVASNLAVQTIVTHCQQAENSRATPIFGESQPDVSERTNRLASAIHLANRKIFEMAAANPEQKGMGATIVSAWIDGQKLSLAHVGDSRAYLLARRLARSTDRRPFAGGRKSSHRDPDAAGSRRQRNAKRVDARGRHERHRAGGRQRTDLAGGRYPAAVLGRA